MIEPNIIFLILFFSLIIAAPSTADRIDKFVTKHRKHGVQLPADEDANKSFPRSALVPGVIVALAGLGLEVNLFVFGRFGDSHPYDWMSSHFSWWVTQLTFIIIFLAILVHAATYPRRWVLVRSTNPGAFLQVTGLVLFFVPLIVSLEADGWYNELYWYRQIMGTRPGESLEATAMVALSWTQLALGVSLLIWGTVVRQIWEDEEVQVEHPTLA